jgi:hypothetical protein
LLEVDIALEKENPLVAVVVLLDVDTVGILDLDRLLSTIAFLVFLSCDFLWRASCVLIQDSFILLSQRARQHQAREGKHKQAAA